MRYELTKEEMIAFTNGVWLIIFCLIFLIAVL